MDGAPMYGYNPYIGGWSINRSAIHTLERYPYIGAWIHRRYCPYIGGIVHTLEVLSIHGRYLSIHPSSYVWCYPYIGALMFEHAFRCMAMFIRSLLLDPLESVTEKTPF